VSEPVPRAGLRVAWDGGGEGRLVSLDDDGVVVRSSRAFAPGSRPAGTLGSGSALRMKTHRCKRDDATGDDLSFTLEGRLLDATRELRAELAAALAGQTENRQG
jgi:hypothetical protein